MGSNNGTSIFMLQRNAIMVLLYHSLIFVFSFHQRNQLEDAVDDVKRYWYWIISIVCLNRNRSFE